MTTAAAPSPVVTHVGLCVADLARAEAFYVGALGFTRLRELSPPDGITGRLLRIAEPVRLTAVYLGSGSFVLELLHYDRDGNAGAVERPMTQPGLTHLSLAVEDLAATCDRVTASGGTVLHETKVGPAVMVLDPDGQLIELVVRR
jgi:lactoylglutathione lyase